MVKQHEILADLHVHTLTSDTGLSTLHEVLCGARRSGMRYVAITDNEKSCHQPRIDTLAKINSETGVKVIPGVEYVEALSEPGTRNGAYALMGIHPTAITNSAICTANNYFENWCNVLQASNVRTVAHLHKHLPSLLEESELANFYSLAVSFIRETNMWIEISSWSCPQEKRALNHLLSLLEKEKKIELVFGTGAKYCEDVGRFHDVLELFNTFDIKPKRVININEMALDKLYNSTRTEQPLNA